MLRQLQSMERIHNERIHLKPQPTCVGRNSLTIITAIGDQYAGHDHRQLSAEAVWKLTLASSKEQLCVNPSGLREEHRTHGA